MSRLVWSLVSGLLKLLFSGNSSPTTALYHHRVSALRCAMDVDVMLDAAVQDIVCDGLSVQTVCIIVHSPQSMTVLQSGYQTGRTWTVL